MAKGDKSLLLSHGLLEPHITTTRRGQPSYVRYNVIVWVEFMEFFFKPLWAKTLISYPNLYLGHEIRVNIIWEKRIFKI